MSLGLKPKKYPCIESTIDLPFKDRLIRLWIDEEEVEENYHTNVGTVDALCDYLESNPTNEELVDYICKHIERVNAVQIKDRINGISYGVVAYLVDFSSDVHG